MVLPGGGYTDCPYFKDPWPAACAKRGSDTWKAALNRVYS